MKKILIKVFKRKEASVASRITTDTVAEHRERILAGGRRFKYPIQYARHKLVINAILISASVLIVAVVVGWWQLYPAQNTSQFIYRITKFIPVPVASIDGQSVLYSDYLMKYLGAVHYLEQKEQLNIKSDDGKAQIKYTKQQSMQDAIADAYAIKLADEMGLSVANTELQAFMKMLRQSSNGETSEQTYNAVVLDFYGWSPDENAHMTKNKLLRQKVSYAMDSSSLSLAEKLLDAVKLSPVGDFRTIVTSTLQDGLVATYGASGWVPKSNQDGGLAIEAAKLTKFSYSMIIKSTAGDGYYIVRLLDINDDEVSYDYAKITLTAFDASLKAIIDANKVDTYISI